MSDEPRLGSSTRSGSSTVWLPPSATEFSCLCEECLEAARGTTSFLDAVRVSVVRGELAVDAEVAFAHCAAGHEVVLRRVARPPSLQRRDERQLQIG
jgi:hypothetical protein